MGKVLRPILIVAAVAVSFVPGVGNAIGAVVLSSGLGFGAAAAVTGGIIALGAVSALETVGLARFSPKFNGAPVGAFDQKSINTDPRTPRKFLFGEGLFFPDIRYAEAYGTNQEMVDYIFCLAAHRSHAVDEIWIGDQLAWTPGGGVTSAFSGYLTVEIILHAGPSAFHTAGTSGKWGAQTRLTGCTTAKLTIRRSSISRSSQSPFSGGLGGAVAFVGRGMPVYDPARDSTVPGGSGPQRADNCATWAWEAGGVERGRNPALQQLAYRLGWRINGRRSVGMGMAASRLNIAQFAAAAARCDESVTSATLGPVRRFEAGLSGTDRDSPEAVVQALNAAMNGQVTNEGGQIGLLIAVNNLATPVIRLTTDDVIGAFTWAPAPAPTERYTVVRGEYISPTGQTRFSPAAVPDEEVPRPSLVPRPLTYDLPAVQSQQQAQRIFRQVAQRSLVQERFEAPFGVRARVLKRHQVIEFDFTPKGWSAKLFTVEAVNRQPDGSTLVSLRRADASVFAWDNSDTAPVVPVAPVPFNRALAKSWLMAGIAAGATENRDGGGNMISDPVTLDGATVSGGASIAVVDGLTMGLVVGSLGATVNYDDFRPVRGGEEIFFAVDVYTDVSTPDLIEFGYNWRDAAGNLYAENLPAMAMLGNVAVGITAKSRREQRTAMPSAAVAARFYGRRSSWTLNGTFFTFAPLMSRQQPGADSTRNVLPELNRNAWAAGVFYKLGDIVTRNGSSYTCIFAHTSDIGNQPLGSNWALLASAGAAGANGANGAPGPTGPTGVSAPPIKALPTGAATLDPIRLENGQTLTVQAHLFLNTGGSSGVCSLTVEISVLGSGSWLTMSGGSASDSPPTSEPVELIVGAATFTNSSGVAQLYEVRTVSERRGRGVNQPLSFVRVV